MGRAWQRSCSLSSWGGTLPAISLLTEASTAPPGRGGETKPWVTDAGGDSECTTGRRSGALGGGQCESLYKVV